MSDSAEPLTSIPGRQPGVEPQIADRFTTDRNFGGFTLRHYD